MRNENTDGLGEVITKKYKKSGMDVDTFIVSQIKNLGAFDIKYLHTSGDDRYAYFHIIGKSNVLTIYYWESRDEWFCKA